MIWITPELFHNWSKKITIRKRILLITSLILFSLAYLMWAQVHTSSPIILYGLMLIIYLLGLQTLIICLFLLVFNKLLSSLEQESLLKKIYRIKEWIETGIFCVLLPAPIILLLSSIYQIN